MNRKAVRSRLREVGIIPSVRVPSAEDARFAADTVADGGIPVAEISLNIPGAIQVIAALSKDAPDMVVGAGSVLDVEMARRCVDAGAKFLTTDGLIPEIVEYANVEDIVVLPGALTPTEVVAAWRTGSDFVKVMPCAALGGEQYIKALKTPLAQVPLVAAGGVNQQSAPGYLAAGATALGIGQALFPWEAVALRQANRIRELARRFRNFVEISRREEGPRAEEIVIKRAPSFVFKEA